MDAIHLGDLKVEFIERLLEAVKVDGHDAVMTYEAPAGWILRFCSHGTGEAIAKIRRKENPWPDEEDEDA